MVSMSAQGTIGVVSRIDVVRGVGDVLHKTLVRQCRT
jgi:hypothetical protein